MGVSKTNPFPTEKPMSNTSHASQVSTTQDLIGATTSEIRQAKVTEHINSSQAAMLAQHASNARQRS